MNEVVIGAIGAVSTFLSGFTAWFFARKENNVKLKSSQQELEIKLTQKYENLLDNFDKRLKTALSDLDRSTAAIRQRDKMIDELTEDRRLQDRKVKELIEKVEELTDELKKYKQLNGKKL